MTKGFVMIVLSQVISLMVFAKGVKNPPIQPLKEGVGYEKVVAYCVICHSQEYIKMNAMVMDRAGWEKTVHKMVQVYGAPISESDQKIIIDYLETNYSQVNPATSSSPN
jgi:hypothetical protein